MKPNYSYEDILALDFPPVIVYAVPVMIFLTLMEWFLRRREYKHELAEAIARGDDRGIADKYKYDVKDGLAAAGVGIGNLISTAAVKALTFGVILFFYNLTPLYVPTAWWSFIVCFFVVDFCRYWAHRVAHEQRFWWATHVTHHSSEQYNFSVSFRLSWTQHIKVIFFIPAALLGFDPFVFFICMQIGVLYQFWIHTEMIDKMWAPVEFFFVTPSHHRVHHATEEKYLDKNYGSSFIIWDRIFGTFCPEQETPNYGILTPVNSYNPVKLVFHEHWDMFRDMNTYRHPKAWWRIMFGGPGMTLDKEKYYGFYRNGGAVAGAVLVEQEADSPGNNPRKVIV
ncbi:sterol desaturase family protein [Neolewinella antarctica]|uniref:Sterol desaturase/sphingolipid hydroxylase (Fatty acid hydroxylase superfamily) n=1 Tax=Neolewinella antarctica TaxID=442734 RepID=A0ABX0X6R2_9BACT|nr:sterol desaturase family protein [Neolewinella antarctica]NJC24679.1 sterol desaturase/sphingolipid hydroxylase (fatty acid hydroxylase superfamily) [Neolewinella antarctica]